MDPSSLKRYHLHEWEPIDLFNAYYSATAVKCITDEALRFPIEQLYKVAGQGQITGERLIDISAGPNIYHLLPIFEFFRDITILEFSDLCVKELEKWKNKESESYDWTHALSIMSELQVALTRDISFSLMDWYLKALHLDPGPHDNAVIMAVDPSRQKWYCIRNPRQCNDLAREGD
ncbi:indolethylamine N-methyltransferase [Pelobates cultripes]|uniref:Indolethylamine N-methyltransferase n=1 Tax=Pelobates cultripes TaxID=61616 RepID=A0AAD1T6F9_PELCU|nr:indolethylamine N-methyltransferase [Pelobates cultripes]